MSRKQNRISEHRTKLTNFLTSWTHRNNFKNLLIQFLVKKGPPEKIIISGMFCPQFVLVHFFRRARTNWADLFFTVTCGKQGNLNHEPWAAKSVQGLCKSIIVRVFFCYLLLPLCETNFWPATMPPGCDFSVWPGCVPALLLFSIFAATHHTRQILVDF